MVVKMLPFGTELEFNVSKTGAFKSKYNYDARTKIKSLLDKIPLKYRWHIDTDESCGLELKTQVEKADIKFPYPYEQDIEDDLHKICKYLKEFHHKTDRRCGLHVHFDTSFLGLAAIKRVYLGFIIYETLFNRLVSNSRVNNIYCRNLCSPLLMNRRKLLRFLESVISVKEKDELPDLFDDRYVKLNLLSIRDHDTLEFRSKEGTLNSDEIMAWVNLLNIFIHHFKNEKTDNVIYDFLNLREINVNLNSSRTFRQREFFKIFFVGTGLDTIDSKLSEEKNRVSYRDLRLHSFVQRYWKKI